MRQYNETLKNISFKSDNLLINMKFENIQRTVSTPNLEALQQKPLIFQKVESQMKVQINMSNLFRLLIQSFGTCCPKEKIKSLNSLSMKN